jgi:hypothetical protein
MKLVRLAAATLGVLMVIAYLPGTAIASDKSDVMAVVNGAVAAFNKGDESKWKSYGTSPGFIISDVPPYQYQGSTASADWWSSATAQNKKSGITNTMVTLGAAWVLSVTGSHAYAAFPATLTFKQKGKTVTVPGNVLTVALQKTGAGWRITSWSFSAHHSM